MMRRQLEGAGTMRRRLEMEMWGGEMNLGLGHAALSIVAVMHQRGMRHGFDRLSKKGMRGVD
jgi:hypothetical protein